jgi:multicomponent Na+:H+ antiporter subunit A
MRSRPSPILQRGVIAASGPVLAFSLYLLFSGHNQPGGGFSGGLVAGVLVVLIWAAGGSDTVQQIIPIRSSALVGFGLVLAAGTGFASLLIGNGYLESGYVEVAVPAIGTVKAVSPLAFDAGVYLTVLGMSLGLVRAFGDESTTSQETP